MYLFYASPHKCLYKRASSARQKKTFLLIEESFVNQPSLLPDVQDLSFEDALKDLESVVRRLEEAIGSYERGALLKERCESLLSQARLKVEEIVQSAQGDISAKPIPTSS